MSSRAGRFTGRTSTLPTPCCKARYGYRRPQGGFFLWLDMAAHGGGEEAVKTLWKGCGVRLLPGKYLSPHGGKRGQSRREPRQGCARARLRDHGRGFGTHRRHTGVAMASKSRQKGRRRLLPGAVESGLRQLMFRGYGLGIVAVACAAWASLATWSIYDPSFNNATQAAPRNVLGSWGAILADLAMQSLGLAAIVLFSAAWRHGAGTSLCARCRNGAARASSSGRSPCSCSRLPFPRCRQPKSWPLPNGLGGILGDLFMTGALFIGVSARRRGVLRGGAPLPHRRHLVSALRLRHQHHFAHRLVGAAHKLPSEWANASLGAAMHVAMHTGAKIKRGFWWRKADGETDEAPDLDDDRKAMVEEAEPDPDGRIEADVRS